ncbi:homeotic protein spalt-major isoform X1 [Diorhabda carinulata]|uniref:homeotic protein spalt-major isoform X1 n=1 Tax=Diorhabda carinulata TaxID=1163345 RepID=UPI0025A2B906|nr:homeotic protein spalt-major isoform X1 [Diorhabda carinulata]
MEQHAELCETYQLKWNYYSSYMHSCIATSLYNESYADVALVTMDGHQVMAHRYVLSYSSRYLAQILKYQRKVTTTLPLMIVMPPEIDYKSLKVLLRYMYSGEAKVPKEILKQVLRGGDILQIKGLYREKEDDKAEKQSQQSIQSPSPINHTPTTTPSTTPIPVVPSPPPLISCTAPQPAVTTSTPKMPIKITKSTNSTVSAVTTSTTKAPITPTFVLLQKPSEVQAFGNASSSGPTVFNFTLLPSSGKEADTLKSKTSDESTAGGDPKTVIKTEASNNLQYLMIKDEPVDWSDVDMKVIECQEVYEEIQVKSEREDSNSPECPPNEDKLFSPLTCELCTETFSIPREWVRHVQTHTDMLPAKRRRRDSTGGSDSYGDETFPELTCDLCQKPFTTPAEWVKHIQSAHTEFELHVSNRQKAKNYTKESPRESKKENEKEKVGVNYCKLCNKTFPSNASMLIHRRSHTGEKPFTCELCYKTFNVKSNLLRHLRTIHNKIINTTELDNKEDKKE